MPSFNDFIDAKRANDTRAELIRETYELADRVMTELSSANITTSNRIYLENVGEGGGRPTRSYHRTETKSPFISGDKGVEMAILKNNPESGAAFYDLIVKVDGAEITYAGVYSNEYSRGHICYYLGNGTSGSRKGSVEEDKETQDLFVEVEQALRKEFIS